MLNRRNLINAAAAAPLFAAGRLYAAPATGPRLLVVFLRGAYDAANIVIPTGSDFYYSARPNLAVAKDAALPLETGWGLHPALKDLSIRCGRTDRSPSFHLPVPTTLRARISRPRTPSS